MKLSEFSVSAVLTTYRRPNECKVAVQSVLRQTYNQMELVVVEDGSETGIEGWLESLSLGNVVYVRHPSNLGLGAARNTGVRAAGANYVAFLDDDDQWLPTKIREQVDLAQDRSSGQVELVIYCGAFVMNDQELLVGINHPTLSGPIKSAVANKGLRTVPSSLLVRREALMNLGGFDEDLRSHVDHGLWLKMAEAGMSCTFVDRPLVRTHEHSGARLTTEHIERIKATDQLFRRWEPSLLDWLGPSGYRRFAAEYYGRVCGALAADAFSNGDLIRTFIDFQELMRRYSRVSSSYRAFGETILRRLIFHSGPYVRLKKLARSAPNSEAGLSASTK